jgi:deazaflavin-dependent oxidoreductase (nitroreductase family)
MSDTARGSALHRFDRWLYHQGRPNRLARLMNRVSSALFATGLVLPGRCMTLEVRGRRTGRPVALPVVVTHHGGQRYLVSMLGENTNWVRNVRAAGGSAVLRHGRREAVHLEEVDPRDRAPILRRYLAVAPGARPHVPVDRWAPEAEFAAIADRYPVFRITTTPPS